MGLKELNGLFVHCLVSQSQFCASCWGECGVKNGPTPYILKIQLLTSACLLCKGPGVTSLSAYMIIDFMQVQSLPKELQSETFPRMFQWLTSFPLAVKSRSLIHFTHFCGSVLLFILHLANVQHWHGFYRSCRREREKWHSAWMQFHQLKMF